MGRRLAAGLELDGQSMCGTRGGFNRFEISHPAPNSGQLQGPVAGVRNDKEEGRMGPATRQAGGEADVDRIGGRDRRVQVVGRLRAELAGELARPLRVAAAYHHN